MAWMPLTLSRKRLDCDGTRQAARNQLLMPPAQPTKNRAKAIHISPSNVYNQMLAINKPQLLGAECIGLFRDSPPSQEPMGTGFGSLN
jgi:hypothetical protein